MRGEIGTSEVDGAMHAQVSMYRLFESWLHMSRSQFEDIMRMMMYVGNIGSRATLACYGNVIGNIVEAYAHAKDMVRAAGRVGGVYIQAVLAGRIACDRSDDAGRVRVGCFPRARQSFQTP